MSADMFAAVDRAKREETHNMKAVEHFGHGHNSVHGVIDGRN